MKSFHYYYYIDKISIICFKRSPYLRSFLSEIITRLSDLSDLPGFLSPSIITGDQLRPDLLLKTKENCLYVLELTIGFETNLNCNAVRKSEKYATLVSDLKRQFKSVSFVNLSISSLGIFCNSCSSFIDMCDSLSIDHQQKRYLSPNLQASPFAPHTIYSAVETKLGLIQGYSPFNIFFSFLITTIVLFCKHRLASYKLPCNSEICNCIFNSNSK